MRSSSAVSTISSGQSSSWQVAAVSLFRGRNTWPLFSLWLSSKVTAAWSRSTLSAAMPMLMAISSVTENSTPQSSVDSR